MDWRGFKGNIGAIFEACPVSFPARLRKPRPLSIRIAGTLDVIPKGYVGTKIEKYGTIKVYSHSFSHSLPDECLYK
jgi:hypothetical protein